VPVLVTGKIRTANPASLDREEGIVVSEHTDGNLGNVDPFHAFKYRSPHDQ